jgi:putative transposase
MVNQIQSINQPSECKYCHSAAIVKFGTYKGVQRYYCKICKRKFKADNSLFHMKVPANLISSTLNMWYEGMSQSAIRRHLQQEYGTAPSTATIYEWIDKYTQSAIKNTRQYQPKVGNVWVADETVLRIDGQNVWFWDIIDRDTRYLLSSRVSLTRGVRDAQALMLQASQRAGKTPKVVITDKLGSYLDGIEMAYGSETEHRQGKPFTTTKEDSTNEIERFHGTLKARTKVMRGLKNLDTAIQFTEGWLVHYNYLRLHESLGDKPPAQVAGIKYPFENWADITHIPVSTYTRPLSPRPKIRVPKTHIGKPRKHTRKAKVPRLGELHVARHGVGITRRTDR